MSDASISVPLTRPRTVAKPEKVLARSAAGMTIGRLAASGLGFFFWLVAARLFAARDVGVAAGLVAATMLCTQLAHGGQGHALVAAFPEWRAAPARLVGRALVVAALLGVAAGLAVVGLAALFFDSLGLIASAPVPAAVFVGLCCLGTVNIVLDMVSMATGRGWEVLVRNVVFGVATFAVAVLAHAARDEAGPLALLSAWLIGAAAACTIGAWQARPLLSGYRSAQARPRLARRGVGHHLLTLAERAPGLLLPIVIAERVGPVAAAVWYPAWMMAWAVCTAPMSTGVALFAALSSEPDQRASLRRATQTGLAWAGAGALAVAAASVPVLGLLGARYRSAAPVAALLALGALPFTVTQLGTAVARATGRLRQATIVVASGAVGIVVGGVIAAPYGLRAVAVTWLVVQCALAAWAASMLRQRWRTWGDSR